MDHCKSCGTSFRYWEVWRAFFREDGRIQCASCGQRHTLSKRYISGILGALTGGLGALVLSIVESRSVPEALGACLLFAVWVGLITFIVPILLKPHKIPEVQVGP